MRKSMFSLAQTMFGLSKKKGHAQILWGHQITAMNRSQLQLVPLWVTMLADNIISEGINVIGGGGGGVHFSTPFKLYF